MSKIRDKQTGDVFEVADEDLYRYGVTFPDTTETFEQNPQNSKIKLGDLLGGIAGGVGQTGGNFLKTAFSPENLPITASVAAAPFGLLPLLLATAAATAISQKQQGKNFNLREIAGQTALSGAGGVAGKAIGAAIRPIATTGKGAELAAKLSRGKIDLDELFARIGGVQSPITKYLENKGFGPEAPAALPLALSRAGGIIRGMIPHNPNEVSPRIISPLQGLKARRELSGFARREGGYKTVAKPEVEAVKGVAKEIGQEVKTQAPLVRPFDFLGSILQKIPDNLSTLVRGFPAGRAIERGSIAGIRGLQLLGQLPRLGLPGYFQKNVEF